MCEIFRTRKSDRNVYIELVDGEFGGVKKIPLQKFEWAKTFHNPDFLAATSTWTTDRDFNDSASAVDFKEDWITYATY